MQNRIPLLVTLALLAGCSGQQQRENGQRVCTLIGCESGVEVRFGSGITNPTQVQLLSDGAAPRTIRCGVDTGCEGSVFFAGATPEEATARVVTPSGTFVESARLTYQTLQPNGPGCPPTCRQAEIMVSAGTQEEDPPLPAARPQTITDTLLLEGMPEPVEMRLLRTGQGFPLPFSTYIWSSLTGDVVSSGEGDAVRVTFAEQTSFNRDVLINVFVYPEGTTREQASQRIRAVAASGGAEVEALERLNPYALEGLRYRRSNLTGWVELGRREGRFFHIQVQYPPEFGDGMGPRVAAMLEHWRWEPEGEPLL